MAPQNTSIQSFFKPEVPSVQKTHKPAADHQPSDTSDGFTSSEIEATLHPTLHKWRPHASYNNTEIRDLVAGPGCVALTGRVVNFQHIATPSKTPKAPKGFLKVTVKDDTGVLEVHSLPSFQACFHRSIRLHTSTGEALVRKSRLQPPSRSSRLNMHTSRLQRGHQLLDGARYTSCHLDLSRTRQELLLHGTRTER